MSVGGEAGGFEGGRREARKQSRWELAERTIGGKLTF